MFWINGDSVTPDVAALDEAAVEVLKSPGMMWGIFLPDGSTVYRPGEQWYVAFRVPVSPTTYRWAVEHFEHPPEGFIDPSTAAQDAAQALADGSNTVVVRRYRDYEETVTFTFSGVAIPSAEW